VLYVTVNGAEVTREPTDIVVGNLDPEGAYRVYVGEALYEAWTHEGDALTIETPALSSELLQIRVVEGQ
jgi:hypothetical protein